MHLQMLQKPSATSYKTDDHDDDGEKKKQNGNTVDPVHVFYPLRAFLRRIFLSQIEIFCNLAPYTHSIAFNYVNHKANA